MLRQKVLRALRKIHLLDLAERLRFVGDLWRTRSANRKFRREHPELKLPPSFLAYDAYGSVDWQGYYTNGRQYAEFFAALLDRHVAGQAIRVLDWGSGPGRVIRHLPELLKHRPAEIFGSDYNPATIAWCRRALPEIRFQTNALQPPLDYPDEHFDAIHCMSVFTHLSEAMHTAWRDELLRVLKPGGVLVVTLHGEAFRPKLLPDERQLYDAGKLTTRTGFKEGRRLFVAFHSPAFVRQSLLAGMEILEHITESGIESLRQDVWVARKPLAVTAVR